MTLIDLTVLNLQLNHIIDYELHHGVTPKDARDHIMMGDVFKWLKDKFGDEIDLSIYEGQPSKAENFFGNGSEHSPDTKATKIDVGASITTAFVSWLLGQTRSCSNKPLTSRTNYSFAISKGRPCVRMTPKHRRRRRCVETCGQLTRRSPMPLAWCERRR